MNPAGSDQMPFREALRTLVPGDARPPNADEETLAGIVEEVGEPVGELLSRSLADVCRWAMARGSERRRMFEPEHGIRRAAELRRVAVPGALRGPLRAVRDLLIQPARTASGRIATACATVARWARDRGYPRTSIAYRLAATRTLPESASAALDLAVALAEVAQWPEAERWVDRTAHLARRHADAGVSARAVVARADMAACRGRHGEAEDGYDAVLRRAGSRPLGLVPANAHHGLCVVKARTGRLDEAEDHAAEAVRLFGPGRPETASVLREVGFIRLERGQFAAALPLLAALVPSLTSHARVAGFGSLARAAGGVGDEMLFEDARHGLEHQPTNRWSAEAWLEVARGALLLGDTDEAEELAERALIVAMERREGRTLYLAGELMDVAAAEAAAGARRRNPVRCSASVRSLTSHLLDSIREGGSRQAP